MSKEIQNLEPKALWKHFYNLTQIPRPSGKEQASIEFIKKFAQDLKLEVIVDEVGNVIVRKPATPGMETCSPPAAASWRGGLTEPCDR